jgi:hypothetical protein
MCTGQNVNNIDVDGEALLYTWPPAWINTHTQKTAIQRTSIQNKSTWYSFWFSFSSFDFAYFCLASAHFVIVCVCRSFIVSSATFFSRSARAIYLAHVFFLCCAVPRPSFAFSLHIILSLSLLFVCVMRAAAAAAVFAFVCVDIKAIHTHTRQIDRQGAR